MAEYINASSPCVGGSGEIDWEYYFAEEAATGQQVLIVRDPNIEAGPAHIHHVSLEFREAHENGNGDARLAAQDLAMESLGGN